MIKKLKSLLIKAKIFCYRMVYVIVGGPTKEEIQKDKDEHGFHSIYCIVEDYEQLDIPMLNIVFEELVKKFAKTTELLYACMDSEKYNALVFRLAYEQNLIKHCMRNVEKVINRKKSNSVLVDRIEVHNDSGQTKEIKIWNVK